MNWLSFILWFIVFLLSFAVWREIVTNQGGTLPEFAGYAAFVLMLASISAMAIEGASAMGFDIRDIARSTGRKLTGRRGPRFYR